MSWEHLYDSARAIGQPEYKPRYCVPSQIWLSCWTNNSLSTLRCIKLFFDCFATVWEMTFKTNSMAKANPWEQPAMSFERSPQNTRKIVRITTYSIVT